MPLSHRWPLHPFPKEGEALSSWLWRVANRYKMNMPDLLLYDLGYTDINNLDVDPPMQLLDLLSSRSGISVEQLRSMSLAGCLSITQVDDRGAAMTTAFVNYLFCCR